MNEYVFLVGNDYESNNKEYVSINSDKGRTIVASVRENGLQPICLLTVLIKH